MGGGVKGGSGTSTRLVEDDAKALRDLPEILYVSEIVNTRTQLIFGNMNWSSNIEGTSVDLPQIRSWQLMYGGFFTAEDVRSANKVIVLGANVADQLFGEGVDPTDQVIRVRNHVFKVLGVMSRKGASGGGQNQDDQVFAPWTTVMKKLSGQQNLNRILVSAQVSGAGQSARPLPSPPRCVSATRSRRATPTTSRSRRRTTSSPSARRRPAR